MDKFKIERAGMFIGFAAAKSRMIFKQRDRQKKSRRKNKRKKIMIMQNKRLIGIVLTAAFLLLIPLIAMRFTDEVNWTPFDFVGMGILLLGTGLICEFVTRKVTKIECRIAICAAVLAAFLLIWMELAVGIFGSPLAVT